MIKTEKKDWDALIQETKAYWQDGQTSHFHRMDALSDRISEQCGVDWLHIRHIVSCLCAKGGFEPEQPETVLYDILEILGIEVV